MSFTWDELEKIKDESDQARPLRDWRSPLPPTCAKCSYNLTGLTSDRCPECGTPFKWKEVQRRAARTWTLAMRLRHANQDARMGIILALGGWFTMGLVRVVAPFFSSLADVLAFLAALVATVLGAQVLNVRQVPPWARTYISNPPPSMLLGTTAILLGLLLLFGSILL